MEQELELPSHSVGVQHVQARAHRVLSQGNSVCEVNAQRPLRLVRGREHSRVQVERQDKRAALLSLLAADELPSAVSGESMRWQRGGGMILGRGAEIWEYDRNSTAECRAAIQNRRGGQPDLLLATAGVPGSNRRTVAVDLNSIAAGQSGLDGAGTLDDFCVRTSRLGQREQAGDDDRCEFHSEYRVL